MCSWLRAMRALASIVGEKALPVWPGVATAVPAAGARGRLAGCRGAMKFCSAASSPGLTSGHCQVWRLLGAFASELQERTPNSYWRDALPCSGSSVTLLRPLSAGTVMVTRYVAPALLVHAVHDVFGVLQAVSSGPNTKVLPAPTPETATAGAKTGLR